MEFALNNDQEMIRDSVTRFVEKAYTFDKYTHIEQSDEQMDSAIWQQFAEFGWLGQPIGEAAGGYGGDAVDTMLIAQGLGAGLVLEPFTASIIFAGKLLELSGGAETNAELMNDLVEGGSQLAVAYTERKGRYCAQWCECSMADGRLNGEKTAVLNGPNASHFIVSARSAGKAGEAAGISLYLVAADAAGLSRRDYRVLGGGSACELSLKNVEGQLLGKAGGGYAALEHALDYAIASSCAEALGAMEALLQRTAGYAGQRKQFGVPIGSFQVIQHKIVDMFIEVEQSRSMVMLAAIQADNPDRTIRRKAISGAKAYLGKASKFVAQNAVQLHGGIGVTEELDVGHYFRRLTGFALQYGDRDHHLALFSDLSCDIAGVEAVQKAA